MRKKTHEKKNKDLWLIFLSVCHFAIAATLHNQSTFTSKVGKSCAV